VIKRIQKKLIQKSRLEYYENLIKYALDSGYILTSLSDWFENSFYPNEKVFLLRHDVDSDYKGALKMYQIEKKIGVKSSFYFRWKTANKKIMKEIYDNGFEVSLHYETLATYSINNNILKPEKITEKVLKECFDILKDEIEKFEKTYWKTKTICSHGHKRNRRLGIPNWKILENVDRTTLDIYFETYDQNIRNKFNQYISDSSIINNHNWKYGMTPEEAINNRLNVICLLTHPNHWNYSFRKNIIRLFRDFKGKLHK